MSDYYEFTYENNNYRIIFLRDKKLKRSARLEYIDNALICRMALIFDRRHAISFIERKKAFLVSLLNRQHAITNEMIYIFGESRKIMQISDKNYIEGLGMFKNEKELQKLLKKALLKYVENSYQHQISIMGINDSYKCIVRDMKSRYGSISKRTNRIAISLKMVHYAPSIIDSIIIHELAHTRHFDHSRAFYKEIDKYCKDYKKLQRKLKRGEFK